VSGRTFELQTTSHGPDDLWIARVRGREALSSLHRFDLVVVASEPGLEDVLLGQRATLRMRTPSSERRIHGIVSRASVHPRFRHREVASLRLRIVPTLWTLGLARRSRIFQDRTVPEIVEDVLRGRGIPTRWSLAGEHAPRPYCVQHGESDLAFVQRLLAEEGIFTFFEPLEDEDRLVLADDARGYETISGDLAVPFRSDREGAAGEHLGKVGWARKLRSHPSSHAAYDDPRTLLDPEARADEIVAEGSLLRAAPGLRFALQDAPVTTPHRGLAVVEVETTGWQPVVGVAAPSPESSRTPLHSCKLRCVAEDVAYRPALRPRPAPAVLEMATVVGSVDDEVTSATRTAAWGRVKIRFPWGDGQDDDRASCWVHATQPLSGASSASVPRVGMRVIVGFLAGDPDRPVVLGVSGSGTPTDAAGATLEGSSSACTSRHST
jgi:type VI secretion system secreted protein VgrG